MGQDDSMASDTFRIVPRGSFSWPAAFDCLTRFPPLRHVWKGSEDEVRLALLADGDLEPVGVRLRFDGDLHGTLEGGGGGARTRAVERQVARIFSLDHDGAGWDELPVSRIYPGLRPVCFSSPYEAACWAIISQRISRDMAARIVSELVAEHGSFPSPKKLANVHAVRGLAAVKIDRLRAVALAASAGELDAERLRALGDEAGPASLRCIPGIGPFWSSGIYLRACGIRDVFPDEPLSVAALARAYGLGRSSSAAELREITECFRPFRMWACFLLRAADARGLLASSPLAA
jgi:DNA-3-methyladenine glycosylase II